MSEYNILMSAILEEIKKPSSNVWEQSRAVADAVWNILEADIKGARRKPIFVAQSGITHVVIADDGSIWRQEWEGDNMVWRRFPDLPQE